VREVIKDAARAVRNRDPAALGKMVSDRYRDAAGNGKREALALVRYQLLQHMSLHLLKQVRDVRLTGPGVVEAEVLIAVADVDITDVRALGSIPADLLRFDLVFVEEDRGTWRLLEAEWGRAGPADFI
jgi:hypothetical protein